MSGGVVADKAVHTIIASVLPPSATAAGIAPGMDLRSDLGLDSVGLMSIVFLLEEELGIDAFGQVQEFIDAQTVADIVQIVRGR